jgi:hypothetical protein
MKLQSSSEKLVLTVAMNSNVSEPTVPGKATAQFRNSGRPGYRLQGAALRVRACLPCAFNGIIRADLHRTMGNTGQSPEFDNKEPLIKWGWPLLQALGPYFKARAKRRYPSCLAFCEQRGKTAQELAALRVALKRGRGLRWLLSYSPLRGCAFEAALPAAPFECNKGHPHLISGSLSAVAHADGLR